MNRSQQNNHDFNPSGVGLNNGNFMGLPFTEATARVILLPVPWDVTVSYGEGTASGPEAIRKASVQVDLSDPDVEEAWRQGIFMPESEESLMKRGQELRPLAEEYIRFLEQGGELSKNPEMGKILERVNDGCGQMNQWVYRQVKERLEQGKLVGIAGGDHSVPLGCINALGEHYPGFGILQIDAHFDLRKHYEGFTYSHASVFYNALENPALKRLVQVGIRDFCGEELEKVEKEQDRITVFFDHKLRENQFHGMDWNAQCNHIIASLPGEVYISFDVDGLNPALCPHTGTPVPGGLEYAEAIFLIKKLVESGRKIIGFDLCETGDNEWDANVGARLLYKMSSLAGRSRGMI